MGGPAVTIAAVIPTRYQSDPLLGLVSTLRLDGVQVVLVPDAFDRGPDWSIYRLWNTGCQIARDVYRARYTVVLNDDVVLPPGAIHALIAPLTDPRVGVSCPDTSVPFDMDYQTDGTYTEVRGTWGAQGHDGMTGFAFAIRSDLPIRFDEGYQWWYGDDQFEHDVRVAGLSVIRVNGLPVWHLLAQSYMKAADDLQPMIERDRARWDARMAALA
jgi:hypothetical protein